MPDGRCLDSEKKLDDFLLEKLRPAFNKELCDHVIDMAATAIPGVDKSELFISDTENEKAACLNVKLDGKVYKEAILPYVSYEGIISSSLYNNLYSRCTVLHKRNIERFEKSHDLKALKQIAESILLSLQVDEKHMQSIEKEQSLRHREVFSGGHNAVRSKKQTDALLNEDVSKLSNADIEKVLTFIRTNAKTFRQKLRKLYITQQKQQIDIKKTIEKSVQCDGEIARLYYKKPIKSKANVVMLADISGSCRAMTSLALTYMGLMREVFPGGCHLFVFVNHLVPVDRYFSNENVTSAVESINKNVPSRGIYSNYGVPLKELRYDNTGIINKDTTIVMLGDCRNNKNYSGVEEVEWLSKRASNFFVLNPDPLNKWGQGDSIADLYAKSGATVCRVSSTQDLLTFLESASLKKHT